MTTPMVSSNWTQWVLPIVRKEWQQKLEAVLAPSLNLFGRETSTAAAEYSQGMGNFGLVPEYNSATAEGNAAAIQYDSFSELYEKTFTHKEYAKGVAIERKLWDDDQSGLIRRRAQILGNSFGTTRATHAASVFNNAFSSDYVGGDGVSLCNASHPVNKVDSGTTFSNAGSTALSYDAVISTIIAGQGLNDDRGNPMPVMYDTLLIPIALQGVAYEQLKGLLKPGTGDNDTSAIPYMTGGINIIVDPYLSDANNWFMLDSAMASMHLLWYDRVNPEISLDPSSDFNLVAQYRGYMRYSFGWDDARFVYGHAVA